MKLNVNALPRDLVLDLIAITRMLYAREQAAGGHPMKLQAIADLGKSLRTALDMAKSGPGTIGTRAAWEHVDEALKKLATLMAEERALSLLQAVEGKLRLAKRR